MSLDLTVTDLFCGAGGSSIGAVASGATLRMAANHWRLAIDTHNSNFPDAAHDCADVSQVDPRRYPSTDILLASPECTHHSQAKTNKHRPDLFDPDGDPSAERSRATMWDVVRFAEVHRYEIVVVENVVEVRRWEPFEAWLSAMDSLGYRHRIVFVNSMVAHPTPQSRDRLYVVFWRAGNRAPDLEIRPPCWCPGCELEVAGVQSWKRPERPGGKFRQQYLYRCSTCGGEVWPMAYPAASAIDWTLPCPRIGDRPKPLAPATRRRVEIGLQRFGPAMLAQVGGHTYEAGGYVRAWPIGSPAPAQTATLSHALVVETSYSGNERTPVWSALPFPTQTARQSMALAVPAIFVKNYGSEAEAKYRAHPVESPLGAITAQGDSHALVTLPFIAELRGGWSEARGVGEPAATVTGGGNHHGLVIPPAFYVKNYGPGGEDPSMSHDVAEPLGAVTATDHHSLVSLPFTVDYHGTGHAHQVGDPLPTQDSRDRHALVLPDLDVDDCGFRMLTPEEIGRAMAFPSSYIVMGNKRERVRQFGNAVTPPVMALLVERCIESLS